MIIALTYGRESQWVHNVLAQDGCELETEGRTISLSHPYLSRDGERGTIPAFVRFMLRLLNVSHFLELTLTETVASQ